MPNTQKPPIVRVVLQSAGGYFDNHVGAGHSRGNERELRARNHADPLDSDLQLTSRDREDVLGAVGPEADGFHNFLVAVVHYYLLHTPQGSIQPQ